LLNRRIVLISCTVLSYLRLNSGTEVVRWNLNIPFGQNMISAWDTTLVKR
jgi:hypothetical protein